MKERITYGSKLNRRHFLLGSGAMAGSLAGPFLRVLHGYPVRFKEDPFTLGVASGDPLPDGVVLWTRLAPDPLNGGGMPPQRIAVDWRVASDEGMQRVVQRGREWALPELGHSVHAEVRGLAPSRWYWYQFNAGDAWSPVGRTRTAPARSAQVEQLRFAFVSCQHYEQGLYTAFDHLSREEIELIVHLGDYIYEGAAGEGRIRRHDGPEILTLDAYRNRYALYKSDPFLRAAHAGFPWVVTPDDHEVDNNYADAVPEDSTPRGEFLARRALAYQAYFEHMPLRRSSLPKGPSMRLYRRLRFGDLAEFSVLDTRQYRTDQPCGDGLKPRCPETLEARATLTGPEQERWLLQGLGRSNVRWNVIAQQVMMGQVDRSAGSERLYSMDQWSGYVAARNRILSFLHQRRTSNPVVISGDIHTNWVADLKTDFDDPNSPVVATEFVGTSISSGGDGSDTRPGIEALQAKNPHIRFFNGQRGYVRCRITRNRWETDFRIVPFVTRPGAPVETRASFLVENGKPGAVRQSG